MLKFSIAKILIIFCVLVILSSFLKAQPILKKIEDAEGRADEIITLTLRGENLREVIRIDKVRFDGYQIDVIDQPEIESDEIIKLKIRIPLNAEPGRHKIAVLVADSQTEKWMEPSEETTVVQFKNPEAEILYDNELIKKEDEVTVDFTQNDEGNFSSKIFTLKNTNDVPLSLNDLKLPPEMVMVGTLPDNIPPKEDFTFELQLKPEAPENFDTQLQFTINSNPVTLQIKGKAIPTIPLEPEIPDSAEKLVIIFYSTDVWDQKSKSLILKNIGSEPLTINQLKLPMGFISTDSLPIQIASKDSAIFEVKLDPALLDAYEGELNFAIIRTDTSTFNYEITGKLDKEIAPEIEISDGENIIIPEQKLPIDFGSTSVGRSLQKTFTIRNTGLTTLHLSNLKLPSGFDVVGDFPDNIQSGETAAYTIEILADSAQNVSGNIEFNTNAAGISLVSFPVTGTITIELPEPPKLPTTVIVVVLSLLVGGGGLYFLIKGPVKKLWVKKIAPSTPGGDLSFQFKPKTDVGLQHIDHKVMFKKHFEVRLKPVLDFGNQRIDSKEPLIKIETIASQKSKTKKADDLTRIEGIGPVISGILKKSGIINYQQLSETDPKKILQVLHDSGITGIADPTTWPQQAKLAVAEKWKELDKLQEELKGGRVVHES